MAREPKAIPVDPESETGRLLDEASDGLLVLEKNGVRYLVSREGERIHRNLDPAEAERILAETAGSWSDVDIDALIEYIYRGREEGSRPTDHP